MKILISSLVLFLLNAGIASAQCAMCSTQLENNFSNGNPGIASGMNAGILYLLAMPYIAVAVIGYFWYKSSKNAHQESNKRLTAR